MLKVVVFDGGYGGEVFADQLKETLPTVDVIRVIDWRNADVLLNNPRRARMVARDAILPYIGEVDLIIFANHLLTATSLKYFRRKYRNQKFIGFNFKTPDTFIDHGTLVMTTSAVAKTINFRNYLFHLKRNPKILVLDEWSHKIDDGELSFDEIKTTIHQFIKKGNIDPKEVVLACAQFSDVKKELRRAFGWNVAIYDSFEDAIREACKILGLRVWIGKKIT